MAGSALSIALLLLTAGARATPVSKPVPGSRTHPVVKLAGATSTAALEVRELPDAAKKGKRMSRSARKLMQGCGDQYQECPGWASEGFCDPQWVVEGQSVRDVACKASCGTCGGCGDQYGECSGWASQGFCDPQWVVDGQSVRDVVCKAACGTCSGGGGSNGSGSGSSGNEALDQHNERRRRHRDTPAMSWSDALAASAQRVADWNADMCTMQHSSGDMRNGAGENLYWNSGDSASWAGVLGAWYDEEIGLYDWSNPAFSYEAGHFTQVVWASSTEVGCASRFRDGCGTFVACHYNPAGNWGGQFGAQVRPLH